MLISYNGGDVTFPNPDTTGSEYVHFFAAIKSPPSRLALRPFF